MGEELVMHWSNLYGLNAIFLRFLMSMEPDQEPQELMVLCLEFF